MTPVRHHLFTLSNEDQFTNKETYFHILVSRTAGSARRIWRWLKNSVWVNKHMAVVFKHNGCLKTTTHFGHSGSVVDFSYHVNDWVRGGRMDVPPWRMRCHPRRNRSVRKNITSTTRQQNCSGEIGETHTHRHIDRYGLWLYFYFKMFFFFNRLNVQMLCYNTHKSSLLKICLYVLYWHKDYLWIS